MPANVISLSRRGLLATAAAAVAVPGYAEEPPTLVIRNAALLTTAHASPMAADVAVRGGRIIEIGQIQNFAAGTEVIDGAGCLLLPGLIDTHWHMWNTAARGLSSSPKGGFAPTMAAISGLFTPQANALGVRLALAEAVHGGITTVHNWAHNTRSPAHAEAEFAAMAESGVRGRFAYGYAQDLRRDRPMDLEHLRQLARVRKAGLIDLGVCARGPDRSDDAVWQAEWDTARALGLSISTHIASDAAAAALGGIGKLRAREGLGRDIQLVHMTTASDAEIATVVETGTAVSLSPWTELEVGYGLPPIARLHAAGARLGLSVDNLVLSGAADMFSVMKLTADLAGGMDRRQGAVPDATALDWATRGGADTLGYDNVGEIREGSRADLILVRTDAINTSPAKDAASLLVRSARPETVDTVIIDGVVHKRNGRLARVDVPALMDEAQSIIRRLRSDAGI